MNPNAVEKTKVKLMVLQISNKIYFCLQANILSETLFYKLLLLGHMHGSVS